MPQPKQRGPLTAVGEAAKDLVDGSLMNDYVVKPISDAVLATDLPTSDEQEQIADDTMKDKMLNLRVLVSSCLIQVDRT